MSSDLLAAAIAHLDEPAPQATPEALDQVLRLAELAQARADEIGAALVASGRTYREVGELFGLSNNGMFQRIRHRVGPQRRRSADVA